MASLIIVIVLCILGMILILLYLFYPLLKSSDTGKLPKEPTIKTCNHVPIKHNTFWATSENLTGYYCIHYTCKKCGIRLK